MGKTLILSVFLFVFMISLTSAVAPTTTIFTGNTGINVEVQLMETYQYGEARWSIIHLFNQSNGHQLTPTSNPDIVCSIHLRNSQGFEMQEVVADTHEDHWDLNGSAGVNTPLGEYAYTVICEDTTAEEGGYHSGYFSVTNHGGTLELSELYLYILVITFLMFMLGYVGHIYPKLPNHARNDDGYVINVSQLAYFRPIAIGIMWILIMAITFIVSSLAIAYIQAPFIGELIFGIWTIMMYSNLIILPIWVASIILGIFKAQKIKEFLERGGDVGF